jgi:hypothetical protein
MMKNTIFTRSCLTLVLSLASLTLSSAASAIGVADYPVGPAWSDADCQVKATLLGFNRYKFGAGTWQGYHISNMCWAWNDRSVNPNPNPNPNLDRSCDLYRVVCGAENASFDFLDKVVNHPYDRTLQVFNTMEGSTRELYNHLRPMCLDARDRSGRGALRSRADEAQRLFDQVRHDFRSIRHLIADGSEDFRGKNEIQWWNLLVERMNNMDNCF